MDGSCSDDSGIAEVLAGGGQGPSRRRAGAAYRAGGPGADPGTTSIQSTGGALTYRMTVETLRVQADIACVTYTCTCAVTTAPGDVTSAWRVFKSGLT